MSKNPFLFELKASIENKSYLFGTMHIAEGEDLNHLQLVKEKIDNCQMFATEMDLGHRHIMDANSFHLDTALFTLIKPKAYHKYRKSILKSFDLDLNHINTLKPLIITNILAETVLGKRGCIGLDQYLYDYAKEKEKQLGGVETVTEQQQIMESIPLSYQLKALFAIAKNPKSFKRSVIRMNELYREGKLELLHQKAKKSLGKMRKPLLYDRNQIMATRIKEMIVNQSSFIAIGAGHLAGGKGVIRLLKKAGVEVKSI